MIENFLGCSKANGCICKNFSLRNALRSFAAASLDPLLCHNIKQLLGALCLFVQISQTCPQFIDKAQIMEAYIFVP